MWQTKFCGFTCDQHRIARLRCMQYKRLPLVICKPPTANGVAYARQMLAKPDSKAQLHCTKKRTGLCWTDPIVQQEWPDWLIVILQAFSWEPGIAAYSFEVYQTGLDIKAKSPLKPMFTIEFSHRCSDGIFLLTPDKLVDMNLAQINRVEMKLLIKSTLSHVWIHLPTRH